LEKANTVVLFVLQASIFHKSVEISAFWQRYRSIRIGHIFYGAFRWFFTIKNHLCADDYAAAVCAIKSTQLKQYRTTRCVFFNTRTVIRRYSANDLTCAARKTTFKTRKRFHNKQYPPKSKVQPHGSERTHFDTGFNNSNVAMHRQTFIFLLSHKITDVQQKTTNRNNQSHQTITTNNPRTTQSIKCSKQNITNTKNHLINQS